MIKTIFFNTFTFISSLADQDNDSVKVRRSHRFLIYLGTLMSLGGLIWGTISLYSGIFYESFIPYSYALITLINFTYLYFSKDFKTVQFIQVLASLLLPFIFQLFLGGFVASGAVVLWSILTILGGFTFQSKTSTLRWFIVYLVLVVSSGFIDKKLSFVTIEVPSEISLLFITLNIVLISSIIFTLFYYFVSAEEKLENQLIELANTDVLTNLPNRRSFFMQAEHEFQCVKRGSSPFSILMIDIDNFKLINDTYGHDVGDKAIIAFAALLKEESRTIDILGRYGGEEFIVLLPQTNIEEAQIYAQRIIERCRTLHIETAKGICHFTVSAGLCKLTSAYTDLLEPIKCADNALYRAKEEGKDQLVIG